MEDNITLDLTSQDSALESLTSLFAPFTKSHGTRMAHLTNGGEMAIAMALDWGSPPDILALHYHGFEEPSAYQILNFGEEAGARQDFELEDVVERILEEKLEADLCVHLTVSELKNIIVRRMNPVLQYRIVKEVKKTAREIGEGG